MNTKRIYGALVIGVVLLILYFSYVYESSEEIHRKCIVGYFDDGYAASYEDFLRIEQESLLGSVYDESGYGYLFDNNFYLQMNLDAANLKTEKDFYEDAASDIEDCSYSLGKPIYSYDWDEDLSSEEFKSTGTKYLEKWERVRGRLKRESERPRFVRDSVNENEEDKLEGVQKKRYKNGQLKSELNYKDGKLEGLYRRWHENGQLSIEENYKDDVLNGLSRRWRENGQLFKEVNYKDGNQDGILRGWHSNGQLERELIYKGSYDIGESPDDFPYRISWIDGNGKVEGLFMAWYDTGQLKYEANYKDDMLNGLSRRWYESGQLESETNYVNGKAEGLFRNWYENGQLEVEANYKNGKLEGLYRRWHENGEDEFT